MPTHAELLTKYPEATSEEYKDNTKPQSGKRHVVLSTKYEEPWFGISVKVKSALIQQGCTVYNPNTDNLSLYDGNTKDANDAWLLTFDENLEWVKDYKGFVMQLQQGANQEKSKMQLAEEKQAGWLHVPRIGVWFAEQESRGLFRTKAVTLPRAVELAANQWEKGILDRVQMANETYEVVPGHAGDVGSRDGYLKVTFPCGTTYEGQYQSGKRHGNGVYKYASGASYDGQWLSDNMHGNGVYKFANGNCYEGEYKDGKKHGHGKLTFANGSSYDGQWQDGKQHGTGVYKYTDGREEHGEWCNGEEV